MYAVLYSLPIETFLVNDCEDKSSISKDISLQQRKYLHLFMNLEIYQNNISKMKGYFIKRVNIGLDDVMQYVIKNIRIQRTT